MPGSPHDSPAAPSLDATRGAMGERIRAFDWAATPLGEHSGWPAMLKTLAELLANAKQPMFLVWGRDRTWIYNDAFVAIAGTKHPDALGLPARQVWAEAWSKLAPLIDRAFDGEAIHMTDFRIGLDRGDDVEDAYFDFSYTPIRGDAAEVQGLFGVCIETTERVRSERAQIAAAKQERGRIFEMSRDLFAVATFDGYLKSINPAWSKQLGRSEEELLSQPFADIIHPDDLEETGVVIERLQRGEAVHQFHVRLLRADGGAVSFAWSAVPEGRPGSSDFYTVGRDITDDQKREELLRQSQKMEAVGQLTGGLAHDFNNLLQAVHGNLDLIARQPNDAAKVARWAGNAMAAAERGRKLTAQLLAFSRAQKLELRPTSVAALIGRMDEMLKRSLGPRIHIELAPPDPALDVMVDPTQLEMALLNLAINARDAMPDGGDLTVMAIPYGVAPEDDLAPGNYVEIRVADTGSGMPAQIAARAFDPFFTTKATGKGTGLGLSQVFGMATQAGGTARIAPNDPRGTVVSILLKSIEAPDREDEYRAGQTFGAEYSDKTILVVDDDADVRRFLWDSLSALGFGVLLAEDGEKGLAALAAVSPDVVLLDFAMPGLSGADVADRMRASHPDMPIVFASGFSDTAAIEQVAGVDAVVLKKPFRITDLEAVLHDVLKQR